MQTARNESGGATAPAASGEASGTPPAGSKFLFDLAGIDLNATLADRTAIEAWNPHRGQMALLDRIVWTSPDMSRSVGATAIRDDAFWVPGHFPGKPMFPGVLMVETAAQLACYVYAKRKGEPTLAAFLRLENCAFRNMVQPRDMFYVLCQDVKYQ